MWGRVKSYVDPSVTAVLLTISGVVLAGWFLRALSHLHDSSNVDAAGGAWAGLAKYANAGTLYPPLYAHGYFGGTRFMPVPVLLHAEAARATGEYLVSAKLVALLLGVTLVALTLGVLQGLRCPVPVRLALVAGLAASGAGFAVTLGIRFDALALILQIAAVAIVARAPTRRNLAIAGGLCALAVLSKLSGVWAVLAIASWLLAHRRGGTALFAASFATCLGVGLATFEAASHGRFGRNLLTLSLAGTQGSTDVSLQVERIRLVLRQGFGPYALVVGLAMALAVVALARRQASLWDLSLAWATLVVGVVLLDPGAYINHLVDVEALAAIVVGAAVGRAAPAAGRAGRLAVSGVAAVVCLTALSHLHVHDATSVAGGSFGDRASPVVPLASVIPRGKRILAENAYVAVARGELPVVLDPFMLLRIARSHPRWRADLFARLDRHEFDDVVLLYTPESAPDWYTTLHFGRVLTTAIERNYRPTVYADGYWVYRPRETPHR